MKLYESGDQLIHPEFGYVTVLKPVDPASDDPMVKAMCGYLASGDPGQVFYLCEWDDGGNKTTGFLPHKSLDKPIPEANGYVRESDKEKAIVREVLNGFDFETTMKIAKIIAAISPEDYGYFGDIDHFKSVDSLRDVAKRELESALDNMYKYSASNFTDDHEGGYWHYEVSGVFDVDAWYTPSSRNNPYDLSLKFNITEYSTI